MELLLTRIAKKETYTIGRLSIVEDNENSSGTARYFCDTLEPTWRDYANGAHKIKGRSAIPEGRYTVVLSYSPKFKTRLPLLIGSPDFNRKWQGVRIHAGNTPQDTEGCLLVGRNKIKGQLVDSRIYLRRLIQKISEAQQRGEAVQIKIE